MKKLVRLFLLFTILSLISWKNIQAQTLDIDKQKYAFNGSVRAIVKDGAGNTYVGGSFTSVDLFNGHGLLFDGVTGDPNTNFAKVAGGTITSVIAIPGGGWYIGGLFNSVNGEARSHLARLNADGSLHSFNPNMNNHVYALALDGSGNLYAGGDFTSVGVTNTRNHLCKFDNTGALTSFDPNVDGIVYALAFDGNGNLYAGGDLIAVGGTERSYLCKFDNTGSLTSFDNFIDGPVRALSVDVSGNLYVGGAFTIVGVSERVGLCKFDNTGVLTGFDPNMNNAVYALSLDASGNLYAGGLFSTVGGSNTRNRLCKFDNTGALTPFDPNMNSNVNTLALDASGNLYAGGEFTAVGGSNTRNRLCKFDNTGALTSFNHNMNGKVNAIALDASGNLYAGGEFTSIGVTNTRNRLCKFDNTGGLTPFDPNMNSHVTVLSLDGSGNLYAGGQFTTVGGSNTRNHLCKFDNSGALLSFDPNMNDEVNTLVLDGSGNLYVGGGFTTVGGSNTRNRLCKFDNMGALTSFDPNMNGYVTALSLDGSGNLFAGGSFTTVGGSNIRNRLCKFDNTETLSSFDPNMNSSVFALALDGSGNLYAGGFFTAVGGSNTRNYLCKFDNTGALTSFDPNLNNIVNTLAIEGNGNLYAGGSFTAVGGTNTRRLCKFDNTGALAGFDHTVGSNVFALALDGNGNLYVGGSFIAPTVNFAIFSPSCTTPSAPTGDPAQSFCVNATVADLTVTGDNIQWYAAASGGAPLATSASLSDATHYYASQTIGCESASRFDVSVTINSLPTISSSISASRCESGEITISATPSGGATIKWYDAATDGNLITDDANYDLSGNNLTIVNLTATSSYFAEADLSGCKSVSRTEVVATHTALPTVSGSSPATRCGAGAITIGSTSSAVIKWYDAATDGNLITDDANYDLSGNDLTIVNLTGTTSFYAQAENGSCINPTRTEVIATIQTCYSGGDGSNASPYQIANKNDLHRLSITSADWNKEFIQTASIVLSASDFTSGGLFENSGAGFSPIGNTTTAFTGKYNGSNFSIENLKIIRPTSDNIGFFGYGNSGLNIRNINIVNIDVDGNDAVGGLLGNQVANGDVTNCHVSGTIKGRNNWIGGLIGYASAIVVSNSSSNTTISAYSRAGGFVGSPQNGNYTNCYAKGTLSVIDEFSDGRFFGGFCGANNYGSYIDCYALVNVTAERYVGGFSGNISNGIFTNCYASGNITASLNKGGFCGSLFNGDYTSCYWNSDKIATNPAATGITGKTNAEMQIQGTFTGYNFSAIWKMDGGCLGYPIFQWETNSPVSPTVSNPLTDERCGTGVLDLGATASTGTINWYDAAMGGNLVGSGFTWTTPSISSTTTYYAEAEDGACVSAARTAVIATIETNCTQVLTSQCGTTLAGLRTAISADKVTGATRYRFELKEGANTHVVTTVNRWIFVDQFNYKNATTYTVRVAAEVGGIFSSYGDACSVTTAHPSTKVLATQCGTTLATVSTAISADQVKGATAYKFRITDGTNTYYVERANRWFYLSDFNYKLNQTYTIDVASNLGTGFSAYGSPCTITTPIPPTKMLDTQCGTTLATNSTAISADQVKGASLYKFKITNGATVQYVTLTVRWMYLYHITYTPGTSYSIEVQAKVNGAWGPYGAACTITTPGSGIIQNPNDEVLSKFENIELNAYPNPSNGDFTISSSHEGTFNIINELGQLVQTVEITKENNYQVQIDVNSRHALNQQLQPGIYFITGTLNNEVITEKIIVQ